jgi:hypothetical protein
MREITPAAEAPEFQPELAPVDIAAIWSAHQLALAVGRMIERHHAQIREVMGHAQSGAPLGDEDTEAVRSYRQDLSRIHTVLDTLDWRLEPLDGSGVA